MSTSSDNTASNIIPLFNLVIDHTDDYCSSWGNGPGGILLRIWAASKSAREKMIQYYSKTNTVTMLCTALDPRRRFNYFVKRGFQQNQSWKPKSCKYLSKFLLENSSTNILYILGCAISLRMSTRMLYRHQISHYQVILTVRRNLSCNLYWNEFQ